MERKIGEIFQDGDVTLKAVKCIAKRICNKCYYQKNGNKCHVTQCTPNERKDNNQIIFKQITNPQNLLT